MTSFLFSLYMIMMTMHCFAFYHIIFVPEIPCCLPAYIVPSYVMFLYTNTSYKRIYRLSQLHVRSNRIYLFPLLYLGSILFYTHLCMYFAQDTKVDRQAGKQLESRAERLFCCEAHKVHLSNKWRCSLTDKIFNCVYACMRGWQQNIMASKLYILENIIFKQRELYHSRCFAFSSMQEHRRFS